MTITRLCNPKLVFSRNPKVSRNIYCDSCEKDCIPKDSEYDWFMLVDIIQDHCEGKNASKSATKLLCAQFIRYFAKKAQNADPWDDQPISFPKDIELKGIWSLVNDSPVQHPKDPEGEIPKELQPCGYFMHYKRLQDSQYNIGNNVQTRHTARTFPKSISANTIVRNAHRLSYEEQKNNFLQTVNDADLVLNSVKGKTGGQFEFKTKDGLSYNGVSFITEKPITINPGIHYEQWICSGGEVKCNRTLVAESQYFVAFKQDMKLGVSVWPLVHSDMAVISSVGMFVSMIFYILRNITIYGSLTKLDAFSKKVSQLIFGNNESPRYKNTFVALKMPFAMDGMKSFTKEEAEDYKRMLTYQTPEEKNKDDNTCIAIRRFPASNIVEPIYKVVGGKISVCYDPLWTINDIGTSFNNVYKGFVQMSIEPVVHLQNITCRIQFGGGVIKPLNTNYGSLGGEMPLDDSNDDLKALAADLIQEEELKSRLTTGEESGLSDGTFVNKSENDISEQDDDDDDDGPPPAKKTKSEEEDEEDEDAV